MNVAPAQLLAEDDQMIATLVELLNEQAEQADG